MHAAIYNSFHSKTLNFSPCTSFLIWSVVHTLTHLHPHDDCGLKPDHNSKKRETKKREWPVITIQFMQLAIFAWQSNKGGWKVFSKIRSGFTEINSQCGQNTLNSRQENTDEQPCTKHSIQSDLSSHYLSFICLLVIALLCRWEWLGKGGRKDCIVSMWRIDHMSLLLGSLKSGLEWIPTRPQVNVPHLTFNVQ